MYVIDAVTTMLLWYVICEAAAAGVAVDGAAMDVE